MAPELFQEGGVHSFQSDLWSLGCVLFELATGHPPYVSTYFNELVELILNVNSIFSFHFSRFQKGETPKVEKFSPAFNDLIYELLQKVKYNKNKRKFF